MDKDMDEIQKMMTLAEAARKLDVSVKTIRRYIAKGRQTKGKDGIWPAYRLPGKIVIPPDAVDKYLERRANLLLNPPKWAPQQA